MSSSNPTTFFRWEIKEFKTKWTEAQTKNNSLCSDDFPLVTYPSIKFNLGFQTVKEKWSLNWNGLFPQNFGGYKSVEMTFKIWYENENKEKFCERQDFKYLFDKINEGWGSVKFPESKLALFENIYDNNETVFMCCEILDVNPLKNVDLEFVLNQWKLFEDEQIYDAKIFVGENKTEFKILKAFFVAQSPVFKTMFSSENFNEGKTNEVAIEDMSEDSMLDLIKWLYMGQLDNKGSIEKLFGVADKYQIELLKTKCTEKMVETLNANNVLPRLATAELYELKELKEKSLAYINQLSRKEFAECLLSMEWLDFVKERSEDAAKISSLILDKMKGD